MGVSGLWTLLAPGGENVPLEALSGQRVAVDVSVWLVSLATAAAGGADGAGVRAACLAGLVARCCKLAFLRVRPVFVFDGPAPLLKRRTVRARRAARLAAARDAERARTRLWRLAEHKARLARAGMLGTVPSLPPLPPPESDEHELQRLQAELDTLFAAEGDGDGDGDSEDEGAEDDEAYRLRVQHGEVAREQAAATRRLVAAYGADPSNPAHTAGEFSRAQVRAMQQKGAITHRLTQRRAAPAAACTQAPTLCTVASDPHTQILFCPGVVEDGRAPVAAPVAAASPAEPEPLEIEVDLGAPPADDVMALMREMMASMEKEQQQQQQPEPSVHVLPGLVDHPVSSSSSSSSSEDEDEEDAASQVVPFLVGQVQQPVQTPEALKKDEEDGNRGEEVVVLDAPEKEEEVKKEKEEDDGDEEDDDEDLVLPFRTSAREMEASHQQDEEDAFAAALAAPASPPLPDEEPAAWEHAAKRVQAAASAPEPPALTPPPATEAEGDNLAAFGGVVDQCRELLRLFGIPCVVAPSEADCECAALEQAGVVDAVLSDDSDVLLFGAQHVYRHAFAPSHHLEHYAMPAVTRATSFDRDDLVALALLLGSDYTLGVHGIGLVRAVAVLRVFGSSPAALRAFRAWCADPHAPLPPACATPAPPRVVRALRSAAPRLVFPSLDWPSAAVVDGYRHPLVRTPAAPLAWGVPDVAALTRFCLVQLGWDAERAARTLQPVAQHWARAPDSAAAPAPRTGIEQFLVAQPAPAPQLTRFRSGTQVAEMQKMSPAVLALMKSRAEAKAAAAAAASQHTQQASNL